MSSIWLTQTDGSSACCLFSEHSTVFMWYSYMEIIIGVLALPYFTSLSRSLTQRSTFAFKWFQFHILRFLDTGGSVILWLKRLTFFNAIFETSFGSLGTFISHFFMRSIFFYLSFHGNQQLGKNLQIRPGFLYKVPEVGWLTPSPPNHSI